MILPARVKVFDARKRFWDCLWSQASDALHKSSEIVIIGYRLAPADERARDLIFRAGNNYTPVSICCGRENARIAKELADAGFASVESSSTHFSDWLKARRNPSNP